MKSICRDPNYGCGSQQIAGIRTDNTPDWDLFSESQPGYPEDIQVLQVANFCGSANAIIPVASTTYQATPETIQGVPLYVDDRR